MTTFKTPDLPRVGFVSLGCPKATVDSEHILTRLRAEGQAILLIDKNLAAILRLADRHVVIEKGRVVWTGTSDALSAAPEVRDTYLHV